MSRKLEMTEAERKARRAQQSRECIARKKAKEAGVDYVPEAVALPATRTVPAAPTSQHTPTPPATKQHYVNLNGTVLERLNGIARNLAEFDPFPEQSTEYEDVVVYKEDRQVTLVADCAPDTPRELARKLFSAWGKTQRWYDEDRLYLSVSTITKPGVDRRFFTFTVTLDK